MDEQKMVPRKPTEGVMPCPFCSGTKGLAMAEELIPEAGGGWRVICYGCQVKTFSFFSSRNEAVAMWNMRAAPPAPAPDEDASCDEWGLLVKPPIAHSRSCAFVTLPDGKEWRSEDAACTCGYEWRVRLGTYMTMYNAWRKRAEEAESTLAAELAAVREALKAAVVVLSGAELNKSALIDALEQARAALAQKEQE